MIRSVRPHSNGDGGAGDGGGAMKAFITWNIRKTLPSCAHVVSAIRPPGFVTRASSAAAASGRLANMTPTVETTASNEASSKGKASASPVR